MKKKIFLQALEAKDEHLSEVVAPKEVNMNMSEQLEHAEIEYDPANPLEYEENMSSVLSRLRTAFNPPKAPSVGQHSS